MREINLGKMIDLVAVRWPSCARTSVPALIMNALQRPLVIKRNLLSEEKMFNCETRKPLISHSILLVCECADCVHGVAGWETPHKFIHAYNEIWRFQPGVRRSSQLGGLCKKTAIYCWATDVYVADDKK